jgi:hypothetical protein
MVSGKNSRRQTATADVDFLDGLSILDPDKTNAIENLLFFIDDFDPP